MATVTLRPDGAGAETNWTPNTGANYAAVDEESNDADTTYVVTNSTSLQNDLYTITTSSALEGATISSVQVNYSSKYVQSGSGTTPAAPVVYGLVRHSTTTTAAGTGTTTTTSYADGSYTWNTNPATTAAWTQSDIDNLQIGIRSKTETAGRTRVARVTQVWAVVTYTTAKEPLAADTQSYTLTGVAATFSIARKVDVAKVDFTLTGKDATLTVARKVDITAAEFTLTGIDATLAKTVIMPATVAEFILTGTATGLLAARTLGITVGEFTYSGIDATFIRSLIIPVTVAEFTYTGIDAGLLAAYTFTADNTTYTMTGKDAELTYNESSGSYELICEHGVFHVHARRADIDFTYRKGWNRFKAVTPAKIRRHRSRSDIMRYDDGSWEAR